MFKPSTDQVWLEADDRVLASYNIRDTTYTALLATILPKLLKLSGQWAFYEREVRTQIPAVLAIQARGIPMSARRKETYRRALRRELREIDTKLLAHWESTSTHKEKLWGSVIQTLCWWGWLDFSYTGAKPKVLRRRPAPFSKAEWKKLYPAWYSGDGQVTGLQFNLGSDDQLRGWLFGDLGLPTGHKTDGGEWSVDQESLASIYRNLRKRDEPHRWVIAELMHRARISHIDDTYLGLTITNDLIYPSIKMLGTETGRFTYSDPPAHSFSERPAYRVTIDGRDEHIKGLRGCIEAPPGTVILSGDYMAMEARIFAHETHDEGEIALFAANARDPDDKRYDIHINNVLGLFGWTLDTWLAQPEDWRKAVRTGVGKAFQFGVKQYGANPKSVKTKDVCLCHRCNTLIGVEVPTYTKEQRAAQARKWFARHPNVLKWRRQVSETVRKTGRLANAAGQLRYFATPWDSRHSPNDLEKEAWNFRIQSMATVILRRAMRSLHDQGTHIFMEWHDSLKVLAPAGDYLTVAKLMKEIMERPVPEYGGSVFPVEIELGHNLGEMEKLPL